MQVLNPKEDAFVTEYLQHGVGSKAVIDAGYSKTGASVTANRLLKRPHIVAEIARRRRPIEKKTQLTAERIEQELANLVLVDPKDIWDDQGNLKPISEIPEEARRAIGAISDKGAVKLSSKLGALELAMKLRGMVKQEQTHQAAVQIIIAAPAELPEAASEARNLLPEWE